MSIAKEILDMFEFSRKQKRHTFSVEKHFSHNHRSVGTPLEALSMLFGDGRSI